MATHPASALDRVIIAMTNRPAEVLGASVAVGVALGRWTAGEPERDEQRHGGERVGDVVQRVAEQRDRPGEHNHDGLDNGGNPEDREAQQHCTAAGSVSFERVVDLVGGVMGVRPEHVRHGCDAPQNRSATGVDCAVVMAARVIVPVGIVVVMRVRMAVLDRHAVDTIHICAPANMSR